MTDVRMTAEPVERGEEVLTAEALAYVGELQRRFGPRQNELLDRRTHSREEVARTGTLDSLPETEQVRCSGAQIWQWMHNGIVLESGERVTAELVRQVLGEERAKLWEQAGGEWTGQRFGQARELFGVWALANELAYLLTLPAYEDIDWDTQPRGEANTNDAAERRSR